MSNKGTPNLGLAEIARRVFVAGPAYSLILYTNAQGSLGDTSVYADLVQPAEANGYSAITLSGVWTVTAGVATYVHSAGASSDGQGNPCWYATGAWNPTPVTGAALVYAGVLQHFADLTDPATGDLMTFTAAATRALAINLSDFLQG